MTRKKTGITIGSILLLLSAIIFILAVNSESANGSMLKKSTTEDSNAALKNVTAISKTSTGGGIDNKELDTDETIFEGTNAENSYADTDSGNLSVKANEIGSTVKRNSSSSTSTNNSNSLNEGSGTSTSKAPSSSASSSPATQSKPNTSTSPTTPEKTWHDAIIKQEWVQTSDAWTEYKDIFAYHDVCVCGYNLSANGVSFRSHVTSSSDPAAHGSYKTDVAIKIRTDAIKHEAKGYYKEVIIREAGYY